MSQSLPRYDLPIRTHPEGEFQVWDAIRKQWLVLTPEEQVRQSLILFLTEVCGVPKGLISLEKGLQYDRRKKRFDLLVYSRDGKPLILCECKEPRVPIDEAVVHQIAVYNSKIGAKILLLTNGPQLLAFGLDAEQRWVGLSLPEIELAGGEGWFDEAERLFSTT